MSIREIIETYLKNQPHIRETLLIGVVNYSALSRAIIAAYNLENESVDALIKALTRYKEKSTKRPLWERIP